MLLNDDSDTDELVLLQVASDAEDAKQELIDVKLNGGIYVDRYQSN